MKDQYITTKDLFVGMLGKYDEDSNEIIPLDKYIIVKKDNNCYTDVLTDTNYYDSAFYKKRGMSIDNNLVVLEIRPIDLYMKNVSGIITEEELDAIFNYINSDSHSFETTNFYIPRDLILAGYYDAALRVKDKDIDEYNRRRIVERIQTLSQSYVRNLAVIKSENNEINELMIKKLYSEKLMDLRNDIERYDDLDLSNLDNQTKMIERVLK